MDNRGESSSLKSFVPFRRKSTIYKSIENIELDVCDNSKQKIDNCVDFILVYSNECNDENIQKRREIFENNLRKEGLILYHENLTKLIFVKIYSTKDILFRYCDILKLKMPIKDLSNLNFDKLSSIDIFDELKLYCHKIGDFLNINLDESTFPDQKYRLTTEFSKDKKYLFDTESENFFTTSIRSIIVYFILERTRFNIEDQAVFDVGIQKLINDGAYLAAYPLHDGMYNEEGCQRNLLLKEWASLKNCIKLQPIDQIKDYFGVKVALYFTWLGFYTNMLICASIVGLICIIYGYYTRNDNSLIKDICKEDSEIIMCPLCDVHCDYWNLFDTCTYAKITHLFDNKATIIFSIFMSFWSTLYLELWKRYSAEVSHNWGLTDLDLQGEHPRPQYLARLANSKKQKVNIITRSLEPKVPFWRLKFPSICFSFALCFLWILLALAAVFGVIIYRMSIMTSKTFFQNQSITYINIMVSVTAGIINLICILLLNWIYDNLAEWLTEMELQRTQTEFDNSLSLKIYMFQFVNYYSSIFYIAFIKGKFVGYPAKYNRIFGFRQEECNAGGCLMELCIQLAIIMIGRQAFYTILEIVWPLLMKYFKSIKTKMGIRKSVRTGECTIDSSLLKSQWTSDYNLLEFDHNGLSNEYLEMVLQYGFVTIFVTAFPLAPLFALLNNIFEMRFDAQKILKYYRRPVPKIVKDIGVWFNIMDILGRISVVSNAFIIAFSSNFIPYVVYYLKIKDGLDDHGFLNSTLAYFDVSDFENGIAPIHSNFNVSTCRYLEYRNPPWTENKYKRPLIYWQIMAFRLGFIVLFQNLVSFVTMIVQWAIPDIPKKLKDKIKIESLRTSEIIMKNEMMKATNINNENRS